MVCLFKRKALIFNLGTFCDAQRDLREKSTIIYCIPELFPDDPEVRQI